MVEPVHAGLGAQADAPGSQLIPRVCHVAEQPGLELSAIINKIRHIEISRIRLTRFTIKKYFDT
jgi:hypothetical protein